MQLKSTNKPDVLSPLGRSFVKHFGELKAYLKGFFNSEHDIEDVLQELYIRATEAEKGQKIKAPRAFLYKVTKNLALSYKSQAYHRLTELVEEYSELNVVYETIPLEEQITHERHFVEFCNAVKTLPPKCRKTFVMRQIYGLSNKEIAVHLNISVSTVETHLVKGLLRCEEYLERKGYFSCDLGIRSKSKTQSNIR